MLAERTAEARRERTALRLRLAGLALGTTLVVLSGAADRTFAGAALLAYALGSLLVRYAVPRYPRTRLPGAGIALDVLYASALVSCLPLSEPAWALYAFAIANAAHRYGAWGAVASTAGSIVAFDVMLGVRTSEIHASDLWPVQVLIAIGLLCTELVLLVAATARERAELDSFVLALRDLASAERVDDLLTRLVSHAVLAFGASGAAIVVRVGDGPSTTVMTRGALGDGAPRGPSSTIEIALDPTRTLVARFRERDERREALVHDLATDAKPLLALLAERDRQRRVIDVGARVDATIRSIANETDFASVVARVLMGAASLGGKATVIRRSDGAIVGGETLSASVVARLRDLHPPAIAPGPDGRPRRSATVAAGSGLALVLTTSDRDLDEVDLRALEAIGVAAGGMLARVTERDAIAAERHELRSVSERLREELRSRDDALASTVHELRTPLTSVTAYGQLISRNLQAALTQLSQLDRLIGDLRRDATAALALTEVDLAQQAKEAAQRQRLVSDAAIELAIEGGGPFKVKADLGRLAQVLDNVLGNAVKFSPPGSPVTLAVRREDGAVIVSVTDEGPGLSAEDAQRVFERYYRAQTTSSEVPGLGIGLAVTRDIVLAHGGRIWAESAGAGRGSTFHIALPALAPSTTQRVG